MNVNRKFARIVFNYITKYLLGFLLVFSTSVIVFMVARSSIQSYVVKQVEMQTEDGIQGIADAVDKIELISQMMYQNGDFSKLVYQNEVFPKEAIMQLGNSHDLLVDISGLADYVPYMFVLFKNNDLYLSSSQCTTDFTEYYGDFLKISMLDKEILDAKELKQILFESAVGELSFFKLKNIQYSKDGRNFYLENALLYCTDGLSSPVSGGSIFCFVLSQDYLVENILLSDFQKTGFIYIEDIASGETLVSYGEVPEAVITTPENWKDGKKQDGFHVITTTHKWLGWQIVTGFPDTYVDEQMSAVLHLLMMYLGWGIALVVVLTLYFSMIRFYGFRKVFSLFPSEDVEMEDAGETNEYKLLMSNVERLDEKRRDYYAQVGELKRQNQAILLENLITRGINSSQESKTFKEYFLTEPEFYCVVMVRFLQPDLEARELIMVEMVSFLKSEGIDIMSNVRSGISDELFLIELQPTQTVNTEHLVQSFEELVVQISENYNCILHVGISSIGTGLANISKCYEQTKRLVFLCADNHHSDIGLSCGVVSVYLRGQCFLFFQQRAAVGKSGAASGRL